MASLIEGFHPSKTIVYLIQVLRMKILEPMRCNVTESLHYTSLPQLVYRQHYEYQ